MSDTEQPEADQPVHVQPMVYEPPKLIVYGRVSRLTRGSGGSQADAVMGSMNPSG